MGAPCCVIKGPARLSWLLQRRVCTSVASTRENSEGALAKLRGYIGPHGTRPGTMRSAAPGEAVCLVLNPWLALPSPKKGKG